VHFTLSSGALEDEHVPADDCDMPARSRIEQRRRIRKGERTLVVRVIEYPAAREPQPKPRPERH